MRHTPRKHLLSYAILILGGILMCYPLVWMFFASFKTNSEIFASKNLLPQSFSFDAYITGWQGVGEHSFSLFFINTLKLVTPTVLFTVLSCSVVAYGFARFSFPKKKLYFALMLSTLMLPNSVIIIPRFLLFNKLGWLDSYLPFIVPALFACYPFFIFMMVQFLRGVPTELDEAAKIDGCNAVQTLALVLYPILKPALFSAGLFQLMWTWNDFFNTLVYISKVEKFPLSLGLRISLDSASAVAWNQIMAMALLSILPLIVLFFFAQRYFVEGISTSGIKG
ncbi:MAG: carbohydrate ABC transporter permease [Sphaerochaeta sp.]|jgi:oligogalacturonide transport system permease protein|uniref:carbohydrate ABC transporter permease n=1 Tax=Sphaerochaeta sp. TaxID=1972642 RepID=UPI002FC90089